MRSFAYRLALALGRADVDALMDEITYPQLREWRAFSEIEPFGTSADWFRHGDLMALIANIMRDTKKNPRPYKPSDFIPQG